MSEFDTEQEQLESIKNWFKENGKNIIVVVLLAGSIVGGRWWWQESVRDHGEKASEEYQQLLRDLESGQEQSVDDRGNHIMQAYKDTPYAALAALIVAKIKVDADDYQSARVFYQWVIDNGEQQEMRHIARIRQAKLLLQQQDPAGALDLLTSVDPDNFMSPYESVKGDSYKALGRTEDARKAYLKALDEAELDKEVIQMKLDALGPEDGADKTIK